MEAEITAGMDLLDEVNPGWENQVVLERLNQGLDSWSFDDCGCVLVHLYGDFNDGLDALDVNGRAEDFGFDVKDKTQFGPNLSEYKLLTLRWKRLFSARYGRVTDGS